MVGEDGAAAVEAEEVPAAVNPLLATDSRLMPRGGTAIAQEETHPGKDLRRLRRQEAQGRTG